MAMLFKTILKSHVQTQSCDCRLVIFISNNQKVKVKVKVNQLQTRTTDKTVITYITDLIYVTTPSPY